MIKGIESLLWSARAPESRRPRVQLRRASLDELADIPAYYYQLLDQSGGSDEDVGLAVGMAAL